MLLKIICQDCAFELQRENTSECTHPDELEVDCAKITFCNSFTPKIEVDSPCVTYGNKEEIGHILVSILEIED